MQQNRAKMRKEIMSIHDRRRQLHQIIRSASEKETQTSGTRLNEDRNYLKCSVM